MKRLLLLLPGPMQVPDPVAEAAKSPLFFHRSERFMEFQSVLRRRIQPVMGTESGEVLFLSASGTGAMESAVVNMTSPGQEIIVIVGGVFAERWTKIGQAFGLNVRVAEVDWRDGARPRDVQEAMDRWPAAEVVFLTWSESSTGVLIDLPDIGSAVRERNKWLVADAVSGLAVSPLEMDAARIDVVVSGSQKGLMLPPGLGIIAVGPRAWDRVGVSTSPRFNWDWEPYRNGVPATPPLSLMHQLSASLDFMDALGPGGVYRRRAEVAARIRGMVEACGLALYARRPGNGITAVFAPDGMVVDRFRRDLEERFSILIAGGQGILEHKVFRIGHVGHLADDELDYFEDSFGKALEREMSL